MKTRFHHSLSITITKRSPYSRGVPVRTGLTDPFYPRHHYDRSRDAVFNEQWILLGTSISNLRSRMCAWLLRQNVSHWSSFLRILSSATRLVAFFFSKGYVNDIRVNCLYSHLSPQSWLASTAEVSNFVLASPANRVDSMISDILAYRWSLSRSHDEKKQSNVGSFWLFGMSWLLSSLLYVGPD